MGRATPEEKSDLDAEVIEYLEKTSFRIARWANMHGTCMVHSLLAAICVLSKEVVELLKDSDDRKNPLLRTSLYHYNTDIDTLGTNFTCLPDNNIHWALLMNKIYKGVEDVDFLRVIQPGTWRETVDPIFAKLDPTFWSHLLFVDLRPKSLKEAKKLMDKHDQFFIHVTTDLKNAPTLARGFSGKLSFIAGIKFTRGDGSSYGHAVSVFFDSETKGYLRLCNGNLYLMERVGDNLKICSPDLVEDDSTMEWEYIYYVIGEKKVKEGNRKEPAKSRYVERIVREMARKKKIMDERKEADRVKKEKKAEKKEKKAEKKDKKKKPDNVPQLAVPMVKDTLPNITFALEPTETEEDVTIYIADDTGLELLKWTGTKTSDGLVCLNGPGQCRHKGSRLTEDASVEDVMYHLVMHRLCHRGCKTGARPRFPRQPTI